MRQLRGLVIRRVFWMIMTVWIVLTLAFFLFTIKPDPDIALVQFGAGPSEEAQREAVQAYRERHNYDVPVMKRYLKWIGNYATLQWGETLRGEPILGEISRSVKITLIYLIPSLLVSTVAALAIGVYMALHRGGFADKLGTALAYGGYGVPIFFAAEMTLGVLVHKYELVSLIFDHRFELFTPTNIDVFILPMVLVTGHLMAIQLVFIRSEVIEKLNADFMKTFTASGARPLDLARHALRNSTVPLISAFFTQFLTIVYIDIIVVEVAIGPPGFGALTFQAFTNQDIGLILGVAFVPLIVGIVGNFIQDIAYTVLDPRVGYGDR